MCLPQESANTAGSTSMLEKSIAKHDTQCSSPACWRKNRQLLAKPGVIEARSHSEWPSRGLSSGTPDLNRLACSGIRGEGGAQHAIKHTNPHPGYVPCLRLLASGMRWVPWLLLCWQCKGANCMQLMCIWHACAMNHLLGHICTAHMSFAQRSFSEAGSRFTPLDIHKEKKKGNMISCYYVGAPGWQSWSHLLRQDPALR